MNRIRLTLIVLMCFAAGCVIKPMTAEDLYGKAVATDVPGFEFAKIENEKEKSFRFTAKADTSGTLDVVPNEHGVEYHAVLNSNNVAGIFDAKGNMISHGDAQRLADLQRVPIQQKIITEGETARFNRLMDTVDKGVPLFGGMGQIDDASPEPSVGGTRLPGRAEFLEIIRQELDRFRREWEEKRSISDGP